MMDDHVGGKDAVMKMNINLDMNIGLEKLNVSA